MGKTEYLLQTKDGKRHTVGVSWQGIAYTGGALPVTLDGEDIGTIPGKDALKAGYGFVLADGTEFSVTMEGRYVTASYDGEYLPAFLQSRARHVHMRAYYVTFFIGGFMVFKAAGMLLFFDLGEILGFELYWLVAGALFLMLGYYVKRGSALALGVALLLYILDTASLFLGPVNNLQWIWTMVVMQLILMYALIAGIFAINRFKRNEE